MSNAVVGGAPWGTASHAFRRPRRKDPTHTKPTRRYHVADVSILPTHRAFSAMDASMAFERIEPKVKRLGGSWRQGSLRGSTKGSAKEEPRQTRWKRFWNRHYLNTRIERSSLLSSRRQRHSKAVLQDLLAEPATLMFKGLQLRRATGV
jgi:hypothetical protein